MVIYKISITFEWGNIQANCGKVINKNFIKILIIVEFVEHMC